MARADKVNDQANRGSHVGFTGLGTSARTSS